MVRLPESVPARLWARYVAWSLDMACLLPLLLLLGNAPMRAAWNHTASAWHALGGSMGRLLEATMTQGGSAIELAMVSTSDPQLLASAEALNAALFTLLTTPLLLYAVLGAVWTLGFEASRWQATPGKRALGLRVTAVDGGKPSVQAVLLRYVAAGLSWLTLNAGHAMIAFAPYLALHDRLSRTRVRAASPVLPTWAKAWLGLQLVVGVLACLGLFLWMRSAMQAALDGALGGM